MDPLATGLILLDKALVVGIAKVLELDEEDPWLLNSLEFCKSLSWFMINPLLPTATMFEIALSVFFAPLQVFGFESDSTIA